MRVTGPYAYSHDGSRISREGAEVFKGFWGLGSKLTYHHLGYIILVETSHGVFTDWRIRRSRLHILIGKATKTDYEGVWYSDGDNCCLLANSLPQRLFWMSRWEMIVAWTKVVAWRWCELVRAHICFQCWDNRISWWTVIGWRRGKEKSQGSV